MRVIIAGSRTITDIVEVRKAYKDSGFTITWGISGGANGVDKLAEQLFMELEVPYTIYPANWELHDRSAGYIRNSEMAKTADALIAIWNGKSRGTKHMISIAEKLGLKVYIHRTEDTPVDLTIIDTLNKVKGVYKWQKLNQNLKTKMKSYCHF